MNTCAMYELHEGLNVLNSKIYIQQFFMSLEKNNESYIFSEDFNCYVGRSRFLENMVSRKSKSNELFWESYVFTKSGFSRFSFRKYFKHIHFWMTYINVKSADLNTHYKKWSALCKLTYIIKGLTLKNRMRNCKTKKKKSSSSSRSVFTTRQNIWYLASIGKYQRRR